MPTSFPPLVIPPRSGLVHPMRRPFNVDKDCVLCLLPEIDTKWRDHSLYGNHATLTDTQLRYTGRMGPCLLFDDTARYGTIADADSLDVTTTVTFEAWIYPASLAASFGIFDKYVTIATRRSFRLYTVLRTIRMLISDNGSDSESQSSASFLTVNKWWHVVVTFDSGVFKVYGNGVEQTTDTDFTMTAIWASTTDLKIGVSGDDYFNGKIDEIRIYNRVLELWEIKALYEQGKPG